MHSPSVISPASAIGFRPVVYACLMSLSVLPFVPLIAHAQAGGDRFAQRAAREQHQQMRQQLRADRERRLALPGPSGPAGGARNFAEPPAAAPAAPAARGLTQEERMQLREQLRQASRQRKAPSDPSQP